MILNGKRVTLGRLQAELATAGIVVPALGTSGDDLHTYNNAGEKVELPNGSAPVVAAHVADAPPVQPDYGGDASSPDQIADGVANLRAYLAVATPTNAQTLAALKLTIRAVLFLLRRMVIA